MIPFLLRRAGLSLMALWVLVTAVFVLSRSVPGDPALFAAGLEASPAEVQKVREEFGLDKDILTQYVLYVFGLFKGQLGKSMYTGRPVAEEMIHRLPATIELTAAAVALGMLVGIPLAVISATRRGKMVDHVARGLGVAGLAMPVFWYGVMLQLVFYSWLGWLPVAGRLPIGAQIPQITGFLVVDSILVGDTKLLWEAMRHLILPAFALSQLILALIVRMLRSSLLDVLSEDYIRTAWAKGLGSWVVIGRHAVRNALIPVLTVLGVQIGLTIGGAVLTETIFNWPGIGRQIYLAGVNLDYPVISGMAILIGLIFIFSSLCVDILQGILDPRIIYE